MMRAPFQILAIPYRMVDGQPLYCVLRRADSHDWQFIAGGGEDDETPLRAAVREIAEEGGVTARDIIQLRSICYIPADIFPKRHLYHWPEDLYVLPEYSFGFPCGEEITLSREHTQCRWLPCQEAREMLRWDSNRTALYELHQRLINQETPGGNAWIG